MAELNKQSLEHLAKLARIELNSKEEAKLQKDLQIILNYFEELQEVPTENVVPISGLHQNVFRDDTEREKTNEGRDKDQFPDKLGDFLKVPPVFE